MGFHVYSPYAYDAAMVLVAAMKRADSTDPARYLPELARMETPGMTHDPIAYDERGDLKEGAITVYRVEDGG